ncbi:MAG TPA: Fic family protein [Daejeonella sp.]|nr:Fic family protein [Daejeonella sp.]
MYNWQHKEWPKFTYSIEKLQEIAVLFAQEFGLVNGLVLGLNEELKQEAVLEILIAEAIKTSEIEGEYMSREDVMSSIKNNLGIKPAVLVKDKRASGIAKLMLEVNQDIDQLLDLEKICNWHKILMEYDPKVNAGEWRKGAEPMQVVSGAYGREIVHYEAPPSENVPAEMENFMEWYAYSELPVKDPISKALLKSAIAHLYFETIHPFEDGNGRIGRALAEFTLSQSLKSSVLLSISKIIEKEKNKYYEELKYAQRSLDVTDWINYFVQLILDAQKDSKELIQFTLKKAKFFDQYSVKLNERQLKVIQRMLENGAAGFQGGMTAKKYIAITKTSKATATRDMQELQGMGVFAKEGAGRSVRYELVL